MPQILSVIRYILVKSWHWVCEANITCAVSCSMSSYDGDQGDSLDIKPPQAVVPRREKREKRDKKDRHRHKAERHKERHRNRERRSHEEKHDRRHRCVCVCGLYSRYDTVAVFDLTVVTLEYGTRPSSLWMGENDSVFFFLFFWYHLRFCVLPGNICHHLSFEPCPEECRCWNFCYGRSVSSFLENVLVIFQEVFVICFGIYR